MIAAPFADARLLAGAVWCEAALGGGAAAGGVIVTTVLLICQRDIGIFWLRFWRLPGILMRRAIARGMYDHRF